MYVKQIIPELKIIILLVITYSCYNAKHVATNLGVEEIEPEWYSRIMHKICEMNKEVSHFSYIQIKKNNVSCGINYWSYYFDPLKP